MKVLITGGAGFIGSTVASKCVDAGIDVVILDNLLTGRAEFAHRFPFYCGDIADEKLLDKIFTDHPDIGATVHCAALIVVGDSVSSPARYYENNVSKSLALVSSVPSERVWALRIQFLCRGVRAGQGRVCRRILADRTAESPTRTAKLSSKPCSTTSWQQQICRRYLSDTSIRSEQIRNCEAEHHRHARRTHSESSSNHIRQEHLSK